VVAQTRRLLAGAGYPRITVLCRDGFDGVPERAPFDRIVATVGCADVSPQWAAQLAEDGRLLVPLRHAGGHPLFLLWREDGGLRGRVARWSRFMDARGQLHADRLWSMGIAQPDDQGEVGEREPWPGFGAYETDPGPDDPVDEQDFLFYLSLVDRRACWAPGGVALSDGLNGWATADPSGIRWWKGEALADDLDRHHAEWLAIGRPMLGDYRVAFVPIEEGRPPPPTGWALDRPPSANSSGSRSTDPVTSRERRSTSTVAGGADGRGRPRPGGGPAPAVSRLGFVEVLWIVDHHHDDHDQDDQPIEEGGPPAPADRQGQPLNPGSP
jgi:protein-L-isoaspartate(D-aspartate) O-methyltransferase